MYYSVTAKLFAMVGKKFYPPELVIYARKALGCNAPALLYQSIFRLRNK